MSVFITDDIRTASPASSFSLATGGSAARITVDASGNVGINQPSPSVSLDINRTDAIVLPRGTSAQRPSPEAGGMVRYNTQSGNLEYYNDVVNGWLDLATNVFVQATGGTVSEINVNGDIFRVHTFSTVGTFSFTVSRGGFVEYLIVAGGGGGGDYGGGGAGGYRSSVIGENSGGGSGAEPPFQASVGSISVVVGNLGAGGSILGNQGGNSAFGSIIADGGGGGGSRQLGILVPPQDGKGRDGGSGGGAPPNNVNGIGLGTQNQGFNGGPGTSEGDQFLAGGGGGAGAVGVVGIQGQRAGNGGDGVSSNINGTPTFRGGGGGGGSGNSVTGVNGGLGGQGGGGNGSKLINQPEGSAGDVNTGGGGGGAGSTGSNGSKAGGTGIVIIRYRIS